MSGVRLRSHNFPYFIWIALWFLTMIPGFYSNEKDCRVDCLVDCHSLRMGQYLCSDPLDINPETQQPRDCTKQNVVKVKCTAAPQLICKETGTNRFDKEIPCKWTNGYSYSTTLLLSVFLGFLGADRFYLGHIGMGALKFCTLGFLFVGHIIDIILIATQNILPKDSSNYVVGYYGPAVNTVANTVPLNNYTYFDRPADWFF